MGPISPCYDCDVLRKETMNYISEEIRGIIQENGLYESGHM